MFKMEGIQGGQTSKNIPVGVESIVAWLGARPSSFCGIRIFQEETKKLSKVVRTRMTALSVKNSIPYFQLIDSQSEEGLAEWEQLPAQTVGALQAKIFPDSVMYQRPQTIRFISQWGSL
ncbi:MAG: hypothetical protein V3T42_02170 [Nitrospirales bacterium]|jgi:hypothetical protein